MQKELCYVRVCIREVWRDGVWYDGFGMVETGGSNWSVEIALASNLRHLEFKGVYFNLTRFIAPARSDKRFRDSYRLVLAHELDSKMYISLLWDPIDHGALILPINPNADCTTHTINHDSQFVAFLSLVLCVCHCRFCGILRDSLASIRWHALLLNDHSECASHHD